MPRPSTNTTLPPTYVSDDSTSTPIQQTNQPTTTTLPQANPGLIGSFDKTNLDTENALPNGGIPYSQAGDPTVYPKTTNQQSPNRGYFATPGKAPSKFEQKYSSKNTYLDFIQKYI